MKKDNTNTHMCLQRQTIKDMLGGKQLQKLADNSNN